MSSPSGSYEKPQTAAGSQLSGSDKLQPLLELYFVACLMERTWRFCLPVVLAKTGAVRFEALSCCSPVGEQRPSY